MYMTIAETVALQSSAKRLQVGAIIVKEDRVISLGYNGMPAGWTNECEKKEYYKPQNSYSGEFASWEYDHLDEDGGMYKMVTKEEVIHAEANAIAKLARSTEAGEGSTMFLTHAPCLQCAKQIYTAGIKKVYYRNTYKESKGIDFLQACQIDVEQV